MLGFLVPVVARGVKALGAPDVGAALTAWGRAWGNELGTQPVGFLVEWLFAVAPCLVLSLGAYLLLRREVGSPRYPRLRGLLIAYTIVLHAVGYLLCVPPAGQGWGFYLGEVLFAVLGTAGVVVLLGKTWAVLLLRGRRQSSR